MFSLVMLIQIILETLRREDLLLAMCLPLEEVMLLGRLLNNMQVLYRPLR